MISAGLFGAILTALTAAVPAIMAVGLGLVALALVIRFVKHVWDGKSAEARFLEFATRHPQMAGVR